MMKKTLLAISLFVSLGATASAETNDSVFVQCDKFITAGAFPSRRMEFMCRTEFPMYVNEIAVHRCIHMIRKGFSDRLDYLVCKMEYSGIFKE